jgi:hypothetical protein
VIVFIHDIFLPWDYPSVWEHRLYSEQYLLAVLLLADRMRRYEVVFPGYFTSVDPELAPLTAATWRQVAPSDPGVHASCFWMRVKG